MRVFYNRGLRERGWAVERVIPSRCASVIFPVLVLCALVIRIPDHKSTATGRSFSDPNPPEVFDPPHADPPSAQSHPRLRFHSEPKPLHPEALTHDWTGFLGPTHDGISTETKLLKDWPGGGPTLLWEMVKGTGYSSPAIKDDRLVFFHRIQDEDVVECLHPETGRQYWEFKYPTRYRDRYGYNNGPRASPVIDEDHVYAYAADGTLHCLRLVTGQLVWKRNLNVDFGIPQDFFGCSCTPLVAGNLLVINIGAPGGPCVAAFDKKTGKLVWGAGSEWGPSYASPVPAVVHGEPRIFVFAGGESDPPTGGLLALNPKDGAIDFRFPWRSRSYESVNASCPVVFDNQVFISASYRTGGALLKLSPDGGYDLAWKTSKMGVHFMTPIYMDGHIYGFDGRNEPDGALVCLDTESGKEMWREAPRWTTQAVRRGRTVSVTRGILRGTLLWADGHFLCLGEVGSLHWLDLSPGGYRELSRAILFDAPQTWSPPVLSRGLLYICQNYQDFSEGKPQRLLCYDLRDSD